MATPGLDLLPVRPHDLVTDSEGKGYFYFGALLSLDMTRDFADAIFSVLEGKRLSQYDGVYVEAAGSNYDELEWYPAGVLKSFAAHPHVVRNQTNRATWAYLAALDDEDPVGMHWGF